MTFMSKAADTASVTGPVLIAETLGFIVLALLGRGGLRRDERAPDHATSIPPNVATLGTMQLLNGVAIIVTGGRAVYGLPDIMLDMGNGTLGGVRFLSWCSWSRPSSPHCSSIAQAWAYASSWWVRIR